MNKYYLLFVSLMLSSLGSTQNFDSLRQNIVLAEGKDSLVIERYLDLAYAYHDYKPEEDSLIIALAQKGLAISREKDFPIQTAIIYNLLGAVHGQKNRYEASIQAYDQAIELFTKENETFRAVLVEDNKANIMLEKGFYNEALDIKLKANNFLKTQDDPIHYAISSAGLGALYLDKTQYELARDYLLTAYNTLIGAKDTTSATYTAGNLALAYQGLGKVDSAFHYFYFTRANSSNLMFIHLNNEAYIGALLIDEERYEEAESILQKLVRQHDGKPDPSSSLMHKGVLAECYAKQAKFDSAFYYVQQVEANETEDRPYLLREFWWTAYKSYEAVGDNEKAFKYYKLYDEVQDSLNSVESEIQFKEIETKYDVAEKERLIAQQQLSLRNRLLYMGTLGALLLLGGILLFNRQQKNRLLQTNNQLIAKALAEKETLLKEIHHRVKNNLQVISSLLHLQSHAIDDPKALDAMREGQNRVHSMALIHKNLYQDENLVSINTLDYIDKLTDSLVQSYHIDVNDIKIEKDIEQLHLDVDTMIPLGLILNELISNALKYAFEEHAAGKIKVSLKIQKEQLVLSVTDDGKGIEEDAYSDTSPSMGYRLLRSFVRKLEASLDIESNKGTKVSIFIPNYQ